MPHGIVLFDGTCAFCEGAVKFIAARDPQGYFKFGASQTPEAEKLLAQHQVSRESARSIILIDNGEASTEQLAIIQGNDRLVEGIGLVE